MISELPSIPLITAFSLTDYRQNLVWMALPLVSILFVQPFPASLWSRYSVPQCSCLGPLLFTVYASALFDVVEKHLPAVHCYAYDSQLYISFSPKTYSGQADAVASIEHCIQDIRQWMSQDKLLMNDAKTELLLIGTRQQLAKITIDGIIVGHSQSPFGI